MIKMYKAALTDGNLTEESENFKKFTNELSAMIGNEMPEFQNGMNKMFQLWSKSMESLKKALTKNYEIIEEINLVKTSNGVWKFHKSKN